MCPRQYSQWDGNNDQSRHRGGRLEACIQAQPTTAKHPFAIVWTNQALRRARTEAHLDGEPAFPHGSEKGPYHLAARRVASQFGNEWSIPRELEDRKSTSGLSILG